MRSKEDMLRCSGCLHVESLDNLSLRFDTVDLQRGLPNGTITSMACKISKHCSHRQFFRNICLLQKSNRKCLGFVSFSFFVQFVATNCISLYGKESTVRYCLFSKVTDRLICETKRNVTCYNKKVI